MTLLQHELALFIIQNPHHSGQWYATRYGCDISTVNKVKKTLNIETKKRPENCKG